MNVMGQWITHATTGFFEKPASGARLSRDSLTVHRFLFIPLLLMNLEMMKLHPDIEKLCKITNLMISQSFLDIK